MCNAQVISEESVKKEIPRRIFLMYRRVGWYYLNFDGEIDEDQIEEIKKKCLDFVILTANRRPSSFPPSLGLNIKSIREAKLELAVDGLDKKYWQKN
jgi:hypothetical protein